eukprot:m.209899 g.209899  ORF g.209899 m.209899 type:complete len:50 (-) comp18998_c0_seq15:1609-1758(-)
MFSAFRVGVLIFIHPPMLTSESNVFRIDDCVGFVAVYKYQTLVRSGSLA